MRERRAGHRLSLTPVLATLPPLPLVPVATVPLPGRSPRFDYQSIDPLAHRLYLAHQGDGVIRVIDLRTRRIVRSIAGLPDVHGVLAVPSIQRVFATATATHELVTIDARSGRILRRTQAGVVPDGIAYAPSARRTFVSDERPAGAIVAVDGASGAAIASIALGGSAGNVQYDARADRILVGVETRDEIAVIDPGSLAITRRVHVPGCAANHSLHVSPRLGVTLVGCSRNGRVVELETRSLRSLGSVGGVGHVDVVDIDDGLRRAYVTSEDGIVTTIALAPHSHPRAIGRASIPRAHSVAVDQRTHLVYLPIGRSHGRSALRVLRPTTPRRRLQAGSRR